MSSCTALDDRQRRRLSPFPKAGTSPAAPASTCLRRVVLAAVHQPAVEVENSVCLRGYWLPSMSSHAADGSGSTSLSPNATSSRCTTSPSCTHPPATCPAPAARRHLRRSRALTGPAAPAGATCSAVDPPPPPCRPRSAPAGPPRRGRTRRHGAPGAITGPATPRSEQGHPGLHRRFVGSWHLSLNETSATGRVREPTMVRTIPPFQPVLLRSRPPFLVESGNLSTHPTCRIRLHMPTRTPSSAVSRGCAAALAQQPACGPSGTPWTVTWLLLGLCLTTSACAGSQSARRDLPGWPAERPSSRAGRRRSASRSPPSSPK
jgi:hypothetical protein